MDRLEAMHLLVCVAERGSLSAAGRVLGVPLPTVSRKISDLEAHLQTQLLVRTTRKMSLTEAGVAFVEASRRILDQVNEAERAASGLAAALQGELIISAPIVFGRIHILPVLTQFMIKHPQISCRLMLSDRNVQLIEDDIDVALRIGDLPDSSLHAIRVGDVKRVVCGSPGYFKDNGIPREPSDLINHAIVDFAMPGASRWRFGGSGSRRIQDVTVEARLTVNTAEAALDAAVAGVGVTRVLSYQAARAVARGKLRVVLGGFEPPPVPVSFVYPAQRHLTRRLRAFLDFAPDAVRQRLRSAN